MQSVRTLHPDEIDSAGILHACKDMIPVNTRMDAAIAAHRIAYSRYVASGGEEARTLAMYTLRAVILAQTPQIEDSRQQLDYLTGLPDMAWEAYSGHTLEEVREATLSAISREIMWRQSG